MKKIVLSILIVFSLGVFAASVDLGAKGSVQFNPQANKDNNFKSPETDITLVATNKNLAFNYVMNNAGTTRYIWVESKILGGMGQAGRISPIVSSKKSGGFYGDSAFFKEAGVDMVGSGVSWMTGPWTVAYTGAATLFDDGVALVPPATEAGKLGVAYNADKMGKYAIIMNQDKNAGTIGYDLLVEYGMMLAGVDLSAQVMWGLQGAVQRQLMAVYAKYALDKTQSVYANYIDDLNNASSTTQALSLGYALALNDNLKAIVDYTNNIATTAEDFTVGLDFAL
ncbi:MAG: hypothetical protein PHF25_06870 [Candidatus Margulisbacteria bacterium]|nr:hypothetical protein [Candidatus Margulisiibacteriota bacterium]